MFKEIIKGRNSYDIPCMNGIKGTEDTVTIISHGLGSSKESPTILALMDELPKKGIGIFAFDFPAHGESPVDGEQFRIGNCLDDLEAVEDYVKGLAPKAEITYFSSSFGAYINLIYLATRPHAGRKSYLRSAAVNMPGIFKKGETSELKSELDEKGYFVLDLDCFRPLKITKEFCMDLESHDVLRIYKPGMAEIAMIHGDEDRSASLEDAKDFADYSGAELTIVEGGHHRLTGPGQMDLIIDKAIKFFLPK